MFRLSPIESVSARLAGVVVAGGVLWSAGAHAQLEGADAALAAPGGSEVDLFQLEDLLKGQSVVTASKREQLSTESLSTMSVITREEIEGLPYFYLGEFLAHVPGLDVRWGTMEKLYVGARGLGGTALSSRMLLLWDGIPMNDPLTGDVNAGAFVPLVDVERIEIIRGAGSTMYGSNALSGVINVISRGAVRPADAPRLTRGRLLYGSFGTMRLQASDDEKVGDFRFGASLEALRTDGPFPPVDRFRGTELERHKNDDLKDVGVSVRGAYKSLRVTANYLDGDRGRTGSFRTDSSGNVVPCTSCHAYGAMNGRGLQYPATGDSCGSCHSTPHDREKVQRGGGALFYERKLSDSVGFQFKTYHNEYRTQYRVFRAAEFLQPSQGQNLSLAQRASGAEVDVTHTYQKLNTFLVGAEVKRHELASDILSVKGHTHAATAQLGVFAEDEVKPLDWLALTGGGRFDYGTIGGAVLSPRVGAVISPLSGLSFKAAFARAFRSPSPGELWIIGTERSMVSGNAALKPEWLSSGELGASYRKAVSDDAVFRVSAVGFSNFADDLIGFQRQDELHATFINSEHVSSLGAELEASVELLKPRLKLFGSYSHLTQHNETGKDLPYAPAHKGAVGLDGRNDLFWYLIRARLVGFRFDDSDIRLPPLGVVDASVGMEIGHGFGLGLWGTNLNGDDHQPTLGTPAAPRAFFLQLSYDG